MAVADDYAGMGEFHDLFMDEAWTRVEPAGFVCAHVLGHLSETDRRPTDDGAAVTEYEVRDDASVLRREVHTSTYRAPTDEQLRLELGDAGPDLELREDRTAFVRPRVP